MRLDNSFDIVNKNESLNISKIFGQIIDISFKLELLFLICLKINVKNTCTDLFFVYEEVKD